MPDFNINLLNTDTDSNVSVFYDVLSSIFLSPYILQSTKLAKNSKTPIDNVFLNSIEFDTYPDNLTSQLLVYLLQFLIRKDFYHKTLTDSSNVFEQNYWIFNDDEFKSDLKDISWDNITYSDDIFAILAFDFFVFL